MKTAKQMAPASPKNGSVGTIRTFLADESPLMLALLERALAADQRITIVGSATDGCRTFQLASMSRPDLVLIDFQMSGLDCVEVMRWLKQLPKPPVVFVMACDHPGSRARCLAAGADAFLVKDVDLGVQLQTAIQNFFETEDLEG